MTLVSFESILQKQISFKNVSDYSIGTVITLDSDGIIRIISGAALLLKIGALMQHHHHLEQHDKRAPPPPLIFLYVAYREVYGPPRRKFSIG